mmetsp:Transcript_29212/g.62585  ORF Transcript_29212/g.62585 Transcript_29212/m.62585 type:complete len:202 (-) Transcript_29212:2260-2865(-)
MLSSLHQERYRMGPTGLGQRPAVLGVRWFTRAAKGCHVGVRDSFQTNLCRTESGWTRTGIRGWKCHGQQRQQPFGCHPKPRPAGRDFVDEPRGPQGPIESSLWTVRDFVPGRRIPSHKDEPKFLGRKPSNHERERRMVLSGIGFLIIFTICHDMSGGVSRISSQFKLKRAILLSLLLDNVVNLLHFHNESPVFLFQRILEV